MELRMYFAIVRRWLWLILLCTLISGSIANFFSRRQVPIYAAQATILLDTSRTNSATPLYSDLVTSERLAQTYASLAEQQAVVEMMKAQLGYDDAYVTVSVQPQRDTSLLTLSVTSDVPEATVDIANNLPELVNTQQRDRQALRYFATKENLEEELATADEEVNSTRVSLSKLDADDVKDKVEYESLTAKLASQERTAETLRQNIFNIRLIEDQGSDLLAVIQEAYPPLGPISPQIWRDTLLAAILGAMVGLGAAFFIEYLDDTVKANSDISAMFGGLSVLALVGRVDQKKNAGQRMLVSHPDHPGPVTESYRMLRTNIRFSMVDNPLRTIIVTSPRPSEGKSTTAANLAIVLAEAGHQTILVDADLRRPVQHGIFSLAERANKKEGLTTLLITPDQPVEGYLQSTTTKGLSLLSSGPIPPNPSELLGSKRMQEVLVGLQELADYVIVDTPPVLTVTDSSLLASFASGVLLVLRANATQLDTVDRSLTQLGSVHAKVLGCVINDVRAERGSYYYYDYYNHYSNANQKRSLSFGAKIKNMFSF